MSFCLQVCTYEFVNGCGDVVDYWLWENWHIPENTWASDLAYHCERYVSYQIFFYKFRPEKKIIIFLTVRNNSSRKKYLGTYHM